MFQNTSSNKGKEIYLTCIFVFLCGIISLIGSYTFGTIFSFGSDAFQELLHEIFRDLGIALIIAGSVGLGIEYYLQTHTLNGIKHNIKCIDETMNVLSNSIGNTVNVVEKSIYAKHRILEECDGAGLIKIYEPNSKIKGFSEFDEDIINELEKETNELRIYGISARNFFDIQGIYHRYLKKAIEKNNINIKVLLLDPFSESARKRASMEEQNIKTEKDYFNSNLFFKITRSALSVDKGNAGGITKDDMRFYYVEPAFSLFIFSDFLIMETYHSGKNPNDKYGIIGGNIPSFKFNNESDMYQNLKEHFDHYFINHSKPVHEIINKYDEWVEPPAKCT